jgi:AcrR family transcriptional regulator
MKATAKLSSEERRAAIIKAVRRVFAEQGFHGTTTKELAEAAGVSEALLFKHFPNKEALYAAMQLSCCTAQDPQRVERLKALEPSASTLVVMVHLLVSRMLRLRQAGDDDEAMQSRLMLRSLAQDGDFARMFLQGGMPALWIGKVEECVKAAIAAGDAVNGAVPPRLRGWFTHHVAALTMTYLLPATPVIDYGVPRDKLVDHVVWFTLRGMGLKEEVIKRLYNPKALALFAES